jgi:hypothetical protein
MLVCATRAAARQLNEACTHVLLGAADRAPFSSRHAAYGPRGAPLRCLRPRDSITFRRNRRDMERGAVTVLNGQVARLLHIVDVTLGGVRIPRPDTTAPVARTHRRRLVLEDGRELPVASEWDVRGFGGVPLSEIELGYAATVHRSQGCEAHKVIVVLRASDASSAHPPTRAHVYTAVTRARARLLLVASRSTLEATLARVPEPGRSLLAGAVCAHVERALAAPPRKDAIVFGRYRHVEGPPGGATVTSS